MDGFPLSLRASEINSTESQILKFELSYFFCPIVMPFLQNDHLYLLFYLEKRSKTEPNSEILHLWKAYFLTLEIRKHDKLLKIHLVQQIMFPEFLCPATCCVKKITVSTLDFYIQLSLVDIQ